MVHVMSYEEWAENWNREFPNDPATEEGYDGYLHMLDEPE